MILCRDSFIFAAVLRGALQLELKGMRRSQPPSAYVAAKKRFGLRGSREKVLSQLNEMIANANLSERG